MDSIRDNRLRGRRLQERNREFLTEHPLCMHCMAEGRTTQAEEVDHITPLYKGGDDEWDNLQGLCKPHHIEKTNRDMGRAKTGCDVNGMPIDSSHHWNR